jgi:mannose-6-phosphate isomerase-like protein (cupin superfamily)
MGVHQFEYVRPPERDTKQLVTLGRTDVLYGSVQVIPKGVHGRLHSHRGTDGFWFVVSGRARFVDDQGGVHAEVGAGQGVVVPRSTRYRLDNVGDGVLEILHVSGTLPSFDVATDYAEHATGPAPVEPTAPTPSTSPTAPPAPTGPVDPGPATAHDGPAQDEIRRVLALASQLADSGRLEEWSQLFTDDAELHVDGEAFVGRAGIVARVADRRREHRTVKHLVANTVIDVTGTTATATSDFALVAAAASDEVPGVRAVGRFTDALVREGGRWLLAARRVHIER